MSRYDGLIIPRSYSEYINKTDAATLQQALQLSGVLSGAVAAGDNKAVKSSAVNNALANLDITAENFNLFINQGISQSRTNQNTYGGRKFTDYDIILFSVGVGANQSRATSIIHKNMISDISYYWVRITFPYGSNGFYYVDIEFKSETTFLTTVGTTGTPEALTANIFLNIQGLKFLKR